jgi:hypothetical protein
MVIAINRGTLNVRSYGCKGDGVHDDAPGIQSALDSVNCRWGSNLYFPAGTYRINKGLVAGAGHVKNVYGEGMYTAKIVNHSAAPALTINGLYWDTIRDISINGNGTPGNDYATDATSGDGIRFAGGSLNRLDNVMMRHHGGYCIHAGDGLGELTYLRANNCFFQYGKSGAVRLYASGVNDSINACSFDNCAVSCFGGNGVELWGANIGWTNSAIENCKGTGFVVDGGDLAGKNISANCTNIILDQTRFEACDGGYVLARAVLTGDDFTTQRLIGNLTISNCSGCLFPATDAVWDNKRMSAVEIQASYTNSYEARHISNFNYLNNNFWVNTTKYKAALNANNVLSWDSMVQVGYHESQHINLGLAQVFGRRPSAVPAWEALV